MALGNLNTAAKGMDPATVQSQLTQQWPARCQQIGQLIRLTGRTTDCMGADLFVYGAPKSGKTSVVRAVLGMAGKQHAYFELGETTKPKQLFSSILSQLHAVKRKRDNGYAGSASDSVVEFVTELARACPMAKPTAYIVLDGSQLLARGQLLTSMMQAREIAGANVAYILISSVPWSSQWYFDGLHRGVMPQVYFPAYTEHELESILIQDFPAIIATSGPHPPGVCDTLLRCVYTSFIQGVVVSQFMAITRSVCDLRAVAAHLWKAYITPLGREVDPKKPTEKIVMALSAGIKPRVTQALQAMQPGMTHARMLDSAVLQLRGVSATSTASEQAINQHTHDWGGLPLSAKLLVAAAYIAASNKATYDKAVFDTGTRTGRVRGGKAALTSDRLTEAAREAKLKGPSPFSLNRLLTIYQHLYLQADHCGALQQQVLNQQRPQGLHALRPSFIISAATLTALDRCDPSYSKVVDTQIKALESEVAASSKSQPFPTQIAKQPDDAAHDDSIVDGEEFKRLLAQAQSTHGGKTARTKAKKGMSPKKHVTMQVDDIIATRLVATTSRPMVDSLCAHLPHPASGSSRYGRLSLAPDSAPLLETITALTCMGLLKRASADDMLEAPRLSLGCVDDQLASELARDCGLKLSNYLKYA